MDIPDEKPQVVLVIKDKKDGRNNIQGLLEDRDFVVLTAENRQQALEILKHEAVDLAHGGLMREHREYRRRSDDRKKRCGNSAHQT